MLYMIFCLPNERQTLMVKKQRNRNIIQDYFYAVSLTVTLLFGPTISYNLRAQTLSYSISNK